MIDWGRKVLNVHTRVYAIVGIPLEYSRSPRLFNTLFARYRWNGVYIYLEKVDPREVKLLIQMLPIEGVSITMPHKIAAFSWANQWTFSAQVVGAANTIVRQKDGTLLASNEDYESFVTLVEKKMPPSQQKKVLIVGRGAIAKTSAIALLQLGYVQEMIFLVRTKEEGFSLPAGATVAWYTPLEYTQSEHEGVSLIINATSVGMKIDDQFLLSKEYVQGRAVIDWTYPSSGVTQLIQLAKEGVSPYIDGEELFIGQFIRQFTRFTSINIPEKEVKEILICPSK